MFRFKMPMPGPASRVRERGMSLIEVLVAGALLLVVALGVLALLTRALANNTRGWEATQVSNMVRIQLDTRLAEPVEAGPLQLPPGDDHRMSKLYWASGSPVVDNDDEEGWYDSQSEPHGAILMRLERRVRQYSVKSLLGEPVGFNDEGEFLYEITPSAMDAGLPGDVDPGFVNIRRIEVTFEGTRQGGGLGAGQRARAATFKAY